MNLRGQGIVMDSGLAVVMGLVLLLSPIALVVVAVFWRKSLKGRIAAEQALAAAESEMNGRVEAVRAEAAREVQHLLDRVPGLPGLVDLDAEKERVSNEITALRNLSETLKSQYKEKKTIYDRLAGEVAIFDERLAFAELGVYEPHFDYGDSEAFKTAIANCRENLKRMISDKTAVFCNKNWQVDGSLPKGQTMTNRNIKLTLRAFNNECDAAIANARWNNVNAMEKRILRAKEQIEKLNASNAIFIESRFLQLRVRFRSHAERAMRLTRTMAAAA